MAKPGTNGARRIARGVDLSARALSDEQAQQVQEMIELRQGVRCSGCGRRITVGMQFTSIDPRDEQPVMRLSACAREDCDFAEQAADGATFMEMVEYAWPDANGPDAPAARAIVERNEKRAAAAEAQGAEEASG